MTDGVVLEQEDFDSHTVLRASGYLDVSTSPVLRDKLSELAGHMPPAVLIDLSPIEFIDSSALGVILGGWKLFRAENAVLAVVSPQERITKIFEITALTLTINVYPSLAAARSDLGLAGDPAEDA